MISGEALWPQQIKAGKIVPSALVMFHGPRNPVLSADQGGSYLLNWMAQLSSHHPQEAWWQFCNLGWVFCLALWDMGSVDFSDPVSKHTPQWGICSSPHYNRVASAWDPNPLFTFLHLDFSKLTLTQSTLDEATKWGTLCSLVTGTERTEIIHKRTFDATGKRREFQSSRARHVWVIFVY